MPEPIIEDCGNPEIPSTMSKPPKDWYKKDWTQTDHIATIKIAICRHFTDRTKCAYCQKMSFTREPLKQDCLATEGRISNHLVSENVMPRTASASALRNPLALDPFFLSTTK
jgi:hypothetical protein